MSTFPICLCMTTGRTGTTYLASTLKATYPECHVFHEDINGMGSKPRRYLWYFEASELSQMKQDPDIKRHLARIAHMSAEATYIDINWAILPLVPLIILCFPNRVRLLHLIRDPVTYAASHAALGQYNPAQSHVGDTRLWEPNPVETKCAHEAYATQWNSWTPFEKELWRWTEHHLMALEVKRRYPQVPYQRLYSDALFCGTTEIEKTAAFFGLTRRPLVLQDKSRNETLPLRTTFHGIGAEWHRYEDYPHIHALVQELGIPMDRHRIEQVIKKYQKPSPTKSLFYRLLHRLRLADWRR